MASECRQRQERQSTQGTVARLGKESQHQPPAMRLGNASGFLGGVHTHRR